VKETATSEASTRREAYETARDEARKQASDACTGKSCDKGACKYKEKKLAGTTTEVKKDGKTVYTSTQTSFGKCRCK
jgi:hypothetical protein